MLLWQCNACKKLSIYSEHVDTYFPFKISNLIFPFFPYIAFLPRDANEIFSPFLEQSAIGTDQLVYFMANF